MDLSNLWEGALPLANLTGIQFDLLTKDDIKTISVIPSISKPKDVTDSNLGVPNQSQDQKCSTCGASNIKFCDGHFGCILLPIFIYNPHLIADTVDILNKICPSCLTQRNHKVSNETTYVVSSSDEESVCASIFGKVQETDGCDNQKLTSLEQSPSPKGCKEGKPTGRFVRVLPPRKSKAPVLYNERELMKYASRKHGVSTNIAKKTVVQGSKHCTTTGQRTVFSARKCKSGAKSDGETLHSLNSLRNHAENTKGLKSCGSLEKDKHSSLFIDTKEDTANALTDNWGYCRYCKKNLGNKDQLYPAVRFKVASKSIRGKALPSIIMQIELNCGRKVQDIDWRQCIGNDYWGFIPGEQHDFQGAIKTTRPLLPFEAREIIKKIQDKGTISCPKALFLECVAVTPNAHRVTERYHMISNGPGLTYDDKTRALQMLVNYIDGLKGAPSEWTTLQEAENLACTVGGLVLDYFEASKLADSKSSGTQSSKACKNNVLSGLKWVKDTLLGKRSNLSFRMTAIGDPNIEIDEISIPFSVAENLTICEAINFINWGKLKEYVDHILPKRWLPFIRRNGSLLPISHSTQLEIGDILYRELKSGDLIVINRPPSVHRHSLIALRVKLQQFESIISINPLMCSPFGADFDGDCLHGFIPQSVKCKAEACELMTLPQQMINSQGGQSLIALTHDSLLAAHLMTANHFFIDKFQMQQLNMFCCSSVPKPAILKAPMLESPLWTSKQLFSMVLPSNLNYTNTRNRVVVSDGELLCCSGGSEWLQNSSDGIACAISRDCPSKALDYLYRAQIVLSEWISMNGFSVSLSDVYLTSNSDRRGKMLEEISFGLLEAKQSSYSVQTMYDSHVHQMLILGQFDHLAEYLKTTRMDVNEAVALSKEVTQEIQNIYSDIIKVVADHVEKSNAMLTMIKAGSKGSLQKLVQQGACVGLHMYKGDGCFPFEIPQKLCSSQWIPNSLMTKNREHLTSCLGTAGSINKWYSRGLVENSFCDGLNPLEYFMHGVSLRGSSFGQGADIPGQLFRKLMFFMRDVYVAYDGTVRSTYGKQIVQFSYGAFNQRSQLPNKESGNQVDKGLRNAGEPIGALAASSIGEVAYSSLDKQFGTLKHDPLQILKESLCCRPTPQNRHVNQRVTLRLSKKLRSVHSGLEYGAIEVKEHLEKVILSDLATNVRIVYEELGESDMEDMRIPNARLSPWITHILLCKERLKRKKLTVQSIVSALDREYNSLRRKCSSSNLPCLFISRRNYCHFETSVNKENDGLCVIFLMEMSSASILQDDVSYSEAITSSLNMIHDLLIPRLLEAVVKGHPKIESVNIMWEENTQGPDVTKSLEDGRLHLTVATSSGNHPGELWNIVLNACDTIADLIDWQHSGPDNIYEVLHTMGVEAARKCCLQRLKYATSVMGKPVHEEHLLLIVDCLSVTGVFHGLTPTSLRKQQNQTSVSAPFMQGCFTKPKKNFLEAAKKGISDNLTGTLDALAWGKVVPVGTGVSFDILLNEKIQEPTKCVDVWELLKAVKDIKVMEFSSNQCEGFQHMDPLQNFDFVDGMSTTFVHVDSVKRETGDDGFPPGFKPGDAMTRRLSSKTSRERILSSQMENLVKKAEEQDLPPGFEANNIAKVPVVFQDGAKRMQQCSANVYHTNFQIKETGLCKDECPEHGLSTSRMLTRSKFPEIIKQWKYISFMFHSLRGILHNRYKMGEMLPEADKSIVVKALLYHPRSKAKIGIGVQEIKIGCNPAFSGSRCFTLVRMDGSIEDFSFHKCIKGLAARFSPSLAFEYQQRFCPKTLS
uniref:DNA-directed RNA polymerase n=1 Tax=Cycas revoluta TaxID=3396 RepID=A0A0C4W3D9_CYCRE|nr:DNA-directed RNA polymerase IV largest subunit [Cycas revoluta]